MGSVLGGDGCHGRGGGDGLADYPDGSGVEILDLVAFDLGREGGSFVEDGEGEVVRFISWLFELTITGYGFPLVVEFETAVKVLVKDKL